MSDEQVTRDYIKLSTTSKGEPVCEIKVSVEGGKLLDAVARRELIDAVESAWNGLVEKFPRLKR